MVLKITQQIEQKIMPLPELLRRLNVWRFRDERVVFTNGCFDLLHRGHLHILAHAADLGTRLVVGLNTDASVRGLKGEHRPIQDQQSRAMVLASLFLTDAIVLFDEPTPYNLIAAIKPNVLVKGGDYALDSIVGADIVRQTGGTVVVVPTLAGFSTTNTIGNHKSII